LQDFAEFRFHADFLKICLLYFEFNNSDAVATDYFLVNDEEETIRKINVFDQPIACGIMFKKEQMIETGLYDTSLHIGEDVDFRLRFDKSYKVERINLPLYRYRMHKHNITSDELRNRFYLNKVAEKNRCNVNHTYHSSTIAKRNKWAREIK